MSDGRLDKIEPFAVTLLGVTIVYNPATVSSDVPVFACERRVVSNILIYSALRKTGSN